MHMRGTKTITKGSNLVRHLLYLFSSNATITLLRLLLFHIKDRVMSPHYFLSCCVIAMYNGSDSVR